MEAQVGGCCAVGGARGVYTVQHGLPGTAQPAARGSRVPVACARLLCPPGRRAPPWRASSSLVTPTHRHTRCGGLAGAWLPWCRQALRGSAILGVGWGVGGVPPQKNKRLRLPPRNPPPAADALLPRRDRSSRAAQAVQDLYEECQASFDPNTIAALLQQHPYHLDALLTMHDLYRSMGEQAYAGARARGLHGAAGPRRRAALLPAGRPGRPVAPAPSPPPPPANRARPPARPNCQPPALPCAP